MDVAISYPRIISPNIKGETENTITQTIYLSAITYRYEVDLQKALQVLLYPRETIEKKIMESAS